ncbi:MAG TPA: LTA synthase family protein [Allosphingosinicella sp.]|nr:LTA synthase family protein [Allosphingosinicella sp.]
MTSGRAQFDLAWRVALLGWLGCALLQILLYARPGPYGDPFLLEWRRYFWLSLYFEWLGTWLIAGPFLLLWLALWRRPLDPRWRFVNPALALLVAANLVLSEFDHEILRFLGTRISLSFLSIYARTATLGDGLFQDVLLADRGGSLFPLLLLIGVPVLYLFLALRLLKSSPARRPPFWLALLIAVVPLAAPLNGWAQASSTFRIRRTEPTILALASDVRLGFEDMAAPADLAALAGAWQRRWLAESADPGWRFTDPGRPYWRTPGGPAVPEPKKWNVIYLQLESFRGRDMGFLTGIHPSPTPYLDGVARGNGATVWTRGLSFGMPTINGLFATHCSIAPHSSRFVTSFTATQLYCLPEALRRRGYRAEMFNAGDTDWDNSTMWLKRWYDRLWRFPQARGRDRPVFRAAAGRIRALGRSGRPFFASVVSVSNHTPFNPPEPGFGPDPHRPNLATTRYTDDVVREFFESLRGEAWLEDTLVVLVGDHGFNLGEHEIPAGRISLYHESVWVPIVIAGHHPRLAPGRRDSVATLLDVAPTLADLLGVREPVAWQGRSLVREGRPASFAFAVQGWKFAETGRWSMVQAPGDPRPRLFERNTDWSQHSDRAADHPGVAAALAQRAERARRLNDYLLRHDRVAPR